jgi:hypothetical protein
MAVVRALESFRAVVVLKRASDGRTDGPTGWAKSQAFYIMRGNKKTTNNK